MSDLLKLPCGGGFFSDESFVIEKKNGKEYIKAKGDTTSWNDLTDKPFYEETGIVEVLAECKPPYKSDLGFTLTNSIPLEVGNAYVVNWNGVEYNCIAQQIVLDVPCVALGNVSGYTGGDDTGEPFALVSIPSQYVAELGVGVLIQALDGTTEVTISVKTEGCVVRPIDGKFLPKGTPWVENGGGTVEILSETVCEFSGWYSNPSATDGLIGNCIMPFAIPLVKGNTYTMKSFGYSYTCVASEVSDGDISGVFVGNLILSGTGSNENTGEPFFIISSENNNMTVLIVTTPNTGLTEDDVVPITVSITGNTDTIHKLDNRCLDLAWLPTMVEGSEIYPETQWDGFTERSGIYQNTPVAIDSEILVVGKSYDVLWDGVRYRDLLCVENDTGTIYIGDENYTSVPFAVALVNLEGTLYLGAQTSSDASTHTCAIYNAHEPNKLPAEFLPDDATSFTLVSPNGTKYAITVSDDGTLSATLV